MPAWPQAQMMGWPPSSLQVPIQAPLQAQMPFSQAQMPFSRRRLRCRAGSRPGRKLRQWSLTDAAPPLPRLIFCGFNWRQSERDEKTETLAILLHSFVGRGTRPVGNRPVAGSR